MTTLCSGVLQKDINYQKKGQVCWEIFPNNILQLCLEKFIIIIIIIIINIIIGVLFPLPSLSSPVKKIVLINMWVFLTKNGQSHVNMNEMVNNHKL